MSTDKLHQYHALDISIPMLKNPKPILAIDIRARGFPKRPSDLYIIT